MRDVINRRIRGAYGRWFGLMGAATHEAAHAIAARRYSSGFHRVHLGWRDGQPEGSTEYCDRVSAEDLIADFSGDMEARENAFRKMVIYAAGPVAEARRSRRSLLDIYLGRGLVDARDAWRIARRIAWDDADKVALLEAAEAEAQRLETQHRDYITDLAQALVVYGTVDFGDLLEGGVTRSIFDIRMIKDQIAPPPSRKARLTAWGAYCMSALS